MLYCLLKPFSPDYQERSSSIHWRNWGGGAGGAPPPPASHALAKAMYYPVLPIINKPAPPSQNYPVAPLHPYMCGQRFIDNNS